MTSKRRPTAADYEEMARSYADEPPRAGEAIRIEPGPAALRMGRPTKGTPSSGKTPNLTVRVDANVRSILQALADDNGVKESEIVRQAVHEFIECHALGEHAPTVYTVEDNAGHVLSIHRTEQGAEAALAVTAGAIGINRQLIER